MAERVRFEIFQDIQLLVEDFSETSHEELVHLGERSHGPAFKAALERALPDWKDRENELAIKARDYLVYGMPIPKNGK